MKDDYDKLTEIVPAALGLAKTIVTMNGLADRMVATARRHDRLVSSLQANKVKGCEVKILVSSTAGIQATVLPHKLQMEIVALIQKHYREEVLHLFDDIQKMKDDL